MTAPLPPRLTLGVALTLAFLTTSTHADELQDRYLQGLRGHGYADLSLDYLNRLLKQPGLSADDQAALEMEVGASLLAKAQGNVEPAEKEKLLDAAKSRFADIAKKYPNHPRRAESLVQVATIALQKGRLRILQAQLPANQAQSTKLLDDAKASLKEAIAGYDLSTKQLRENYQKLPTSDANKDASSRRQRAYHRYIEARFQSALARYHYSSAFIALDPKATSSADYKKAIEDARSAFDGIFTEHRREAVGLYAQLWMARCLAAQGEYRKATGLFEAIKQNQAPELKRFQREAFYFSLQGLAAARDYDQLIARGNAWLKESPGKQDASSLGVQFQIALAHLELAKQAGSDADRQQQQQTANKIFETLASKPNEFAGVARREQLKLADAMTVDPKAKNFAQQVSLAGAKLDSLTPTLTKEERKRRLDEAIGLYQTALKWSKSSNDPSALLDAKVALAYALVQRDRFLPAAVLAESVLWGSPKSTQATSAARLAMNAYVGSLEAGGATDFEARQLKQLADRARELWPTAGIADELQLMLGRIGYQRRTYELAAAAFEAVSPTGELHGQAMQRAGLTYWEWRHAGADDPSGKTKKAIDCLTKASASLQKIQGANYSRDRFIVDAILAEALLDIGSVDKALQQSQPLITAIEQKKLPTEVESKWRVQLLLTALSCQLRLNQLEPADKLVALVGQQEGAEQSKNTTAVLLQLAKRLKGQIEPLRQANPAEAEKTVRAYEGFLDRVAGRQEGQTVASTLFLAESLADVGRSDRSTSLLEKLLADDDAKTPAEMLRAKLLLCKNYRQQQQAEKAVPIIEGLVKSDPKSLDVLVERGRVLSAASKTAGAITHWTWLIKQLQASTPRRDEYYQAVDALIDLYLASTGADKTANLQKAQSSLQYHLTTDQSMPTRWRTTFEQKSARCKDQLAGRK